MIKTVHVENFKSLKDISIECRRINVFIGKPNAGKSNILESIGIFSLLNSHHVRELVRYKNTTELFFERDVRRKIKIDIDQMTFEYSFSPPHGIVGSQNAKFNFSLLDNGDINKSGGSVDPKLNTIKFYKFEQIPEPMAALPADVLSATRGNNLSGILLSNKELRTLVNDLMGEFNLKVVVRPTENVVEVQKESEGIVIAYPISSISDTLRRMIFYLAAIKSNEGSTILFEEPEAHAFPYYTKYLSELIALDAKNQYFISTHNPYFLLSIVEKTPQVELAVYVVTMKQGETQVKMLQEKELTEIMDDGLDIFFNMEKFAE